MRGLLAGLLVLVLVAVGAPAAWVVVHNEAANRVEAVFEAPAAARVRTAGRVYRVATEELAIDKAGELAAAGASVAAGVEIPARRGYPEPEALAPLVNAAGEAVGLARIVVDAETLELVAAVDTASPRRSWARQRAQIASNRVERAAVVEGLRGLRVSMTNTLAQALAIDPAAFPAGAQRVQMQATRKALADGARDANEFRRVMLRYLKATE
jgi:hypothetical protein